MTTKHTIYADLGNLRHTEFTMVTESNGEITSQPYDSWKSKKKYEKIREEQKEHSTDKKKEPDK